MSRGGKRTGTQGRSYKNRTDLNEAPSGQNYGDKKEMQDRLDAVPIQAPPSPAPAQQAPPVPVAPGAINRPSERPWEPVTTGLPSGPGPGPEAIGLGQNLEKLRPFLPVLELIASGPDAGKDARNFVRRLRGALGTTPPRTQQPGPQQTPPSPPTPQRVGL